MAERPGTTVRQGTVPVSRGAGPGKLPADDFGRTYRSVWSYLMEVPFEQSYVQAGGLRTRYVHAGERGRPVLLMLHGTGGHWEAFMANLGPMSEHFDCYAVDMMGCGFTDKPDRPYEIAGYVEHVLAFMDTMGIERAHVIGVSLGSWVGAGLARSAPDRIASLIMVASTGLLSMPKSNNSAVDVRRSSASDPSWETVKSILGHLFFDSEAVPDDLIAVRQRVYSDPDIEVVMPRMLTLMDPETRNRNLLSEEEWRSIRTPIMIIAHVDAPDVFLRTAERLQKILPSVTVVPMHETSHWSQFEDPDTFNAHAIPWIKENS